MLAFFIHSLYGLTLGNKVVYSVTSKNEETALFQPCIEAAPRFPSKSQMNFRVFKVQTRKFLLILNSVAAV